MNVKQCNRCKSIVLDEDLAGTSFSTTTDYMEVKAIFKQRGEDVHYCYFCAHKMAAEAGRKLWEQFKRTAEREVV